MPRIASILLFFAVACAAIATDFRLSVNASPSQLAKAKSLHIYGYKFQKGDRIISLTAGRQGSSTGFRITLDSSDPASGTPVAEAHTIDGFDGKVFPGSGESPDKSVSVAIEKIIPPPAVPEPGFGSSLRGFISSPSGYITFAALALLVAGAFWFRPRASAGGESHSHWSLPNRRKSIDESLKEIARRIELIDEHQHELVRKPPVLRTFKAQIDNFDSRLRALEGQLSSVQGLVVKTGESLGSLDRGQKDLKSQADSNDSAVKGLAGSLDAAKQALGSLSSAIKQVDQDHSARSEEILARAAEHTLELQSRIANVERGQEQTAKADAGIAAEIGQVKQANEANLQSIAKLGEAVSRLQTGVDANLAKEVDLSPVRSDVAELRGLAESVRTEQGAIAKLAAEAAAKEVDLSGIESRVEEIRTLAESVQKEQASINAQLSELAAKEVDLSAVESSLSGLSETVQSSHAEFGAKIDDLASKEVDLSSVHSGIEALHKDQGRVVEKLDTLAAKEIDLAPVRSELESLKALSESIGHEQASLAEKLTSVEKAVERTPNYAEPFEKLAKTSEETKGAIAGLAGKIEAVASRDDKERFESIAKQQASVEAGLTGLRAKLDKLEIPSPAKELAEIAAQQKQHADAYQKLAKQIAELQEASAHSASSIEAKISDVSSRTDQRENILLSLQSKVADTEGKSKGASEILPMVADLRLELQSLAADQAKAGAALEGLSHSISKAGAGAETNVQALADEQAKLSVALKEVAGSLESFRHEVAEKLQAPADDSKVETVLDSLAQSLGQWKSESEANQKTLESRLAAALAATSESGASAQAFALDQSGIRASLDALSASLENWKSELEAGQKSFEARLAAAMADSGSTADPAAGGFDESRLESSLQALSQSLTAWKAEVHENQRALEARLAAAFQATGNAVPEALAFDDSKIQSSLEEFGRTLAQWRSDADTKQNAFEDRIAVELSRMDAKREAATNDAVAKIADQMAMKSAEAVQKQPAARPEPEAKAAPEPKVEPVVIEMEPVAVQPQQPIEPIVAQADAETSAEEPGSNEGEPAQKVWTMIGGSQSRRWSASIERTVLVEASDTPLAALTPVSNPGTEHKMGGLLYMHKKVLYGHGRTLKGTWPGRGESSVQLQEPLPADSWRIAALDGHAFCVEEDQVELVNLSTWNVVSRFSGTYVDQICTQTHWAGLTSSMNQLYLDYRNLLGRQLGEPVKVPIKPDQYKAMASEGERVFVGAKDGKVYRVLLGEVKELTPGEKDAELISLSTIKSSLVALIRLKDYDVVRIYGFDGRLQKQLSLGFSHGFDHPVIIGDRMYLADIANRKLVTCSLRKPEITGTVELPGDQISAFCGVFNGEQHALVLAIAEKDRAGETVLMIDPRTGASLVVSELADRQVQVIAADSRIVVSSTSSHQNMIRVFDPFKESQALKAA